MVTKSVPGRGGIPRREGRTIIYHAEAEGWMVDKEECMEVWALKRRGYSNRAIARKLGMHRKTVKKYVETREFPS